MALRPPRLQQDPATIPSVFRRLLDPSQQYQDALTPAMNFGASVPNLGGYNVLQAGDEADGEAAAGPPTPKAPEVRMPPVSIGPVDPQTGKAVPEQAATTMADQAMARATPVSMADEAMARAVPEEAAAPNMLAPTAQAQPAAPEWASGRPIEPIERFTPYTDKPQDETLERPGRRVETDVRGRPKQNIAMHGADRILDYERRLAEMPDDTQGAGWWPRIRAALAGFAAGGPVGAGVAFGARALHEKMDPTFASRQWRQEKQAEIAPSVQSIYEGRKEARADETAQATAQYRKAQAYNLRHPKPTAGAIKESGGNWVVIDPVTMKSTPVLDKDGNPAKARPTGAKGGEWIHQADGTAIKVDESGNDTGMRDPGRNLQMTGAGLVSSNTKYTADRANESKTGEATTTNTAIDESIAKLKEEQAIIDAGLNDPKTKAIKPTIEVIDSQAEPIEDRTQGPDKFGMYPTHQPMKTIANPEYKYVEDAIQRRRQLNDQIIQAEKGRKFVPGSTSTSTGGGSQRGRRYDVSKYLQ